MNQCRISLILDFGIEVFVKRADTTARVQKDMAAFSQR
jgi:hypothetical protein